MRKYSAAPSAAMTWMKSRCRPPPAESPRANSSAAHTVQKRMSERNVTAFDLTDLRITRRKSYSTPANTPVSSDAAASAA